MVYLVDPFSVGHDHPEMHRLITLGLLRSYKQMLDCLPPHMQANVHVQVSTPAVENSDVCIPLTDCRLGYYYIYSIFYNPLFTQFRHCFGLSYFWCVVLTVIKLLQIISLESILELAADSHSVSRQSDQLKCLAFSVFTQCRRFLTHTNSVRSLTGFGPASVYDSFLKPKDVSASFPLELFLTPG